MSRTNRIHRQQSIALSDNLMKEIRDVTKGAISISAFVRIAIMNELEIRGITIRANHGIYNQRRRQHETQKYFR